MATNLRERFGPKEPLSRGLLAEDFVFSPAEHGALRNYRIERESVTMLETPLAVSRRYVLSRAPEGVQLELALCLEGGDAAVALLFQRAEAFQRKPADDAIIDLAREHRIGEVGLSWTWGKDQRDAVLGFVRYNVLVFMQGDHEVLLEAARFIDKALAGRGTTGAYSDVAGVVAVVGQAVVRAGGRLEVEVPTDRDARYFFIANGGAVNRDPGAPARHYYRAGLVPGSYRLTVFRVGAGLLPSRQTVPVTIN
jgi:hypothetical protein